MGDEISFDVKLSDNRPYPGQLQQQTTIQPSPFKLIIFVLTPLTL